MLLDSSAAVDFQDAPGEFLRVCVHVQVHPKTSVRTCPRFLEQLASCTCLSKHTECCWPVTLRSLKQLQSSVSTDWYFFVFVLSSKISVSQSEEYILPLSLSSISPYVSIFKIFYYYLSWHKLYRASHQYFNQRLIQKIRPYYCRDVVCIKPHSKIAFFWHSIKSDSWFEHEQLI